MVFHTQFCDNYLLLKPEEASFLDLFRVLIHYNWENKEFFQCPETHKWRTFKRRWIIFVSIFVQKIFLLLRNLIKKIGDVLVLWLNLLSMNGGFFMLLIRILTGKKVIPEKSSASFTSCIGNLDKRVELDMNIEPGNAKYNAMLSIMASKFAYENENFVRNNVTHHWEMTFLGLYNFWNEYQERFSTQAIMFQDTKANPNLIVVAFRGTDPFDADAWITDVDISWYELKGIGKVHGGFMKALGLQKTKGWPKELENGHDPHKPYAYYAIREMLRDLLKKNEGAKFIVTGHSLGAALAILFMGVLGIHEEEWMMERLEGVYTFGQPRVGDDKFGDFMMERMERYDVKYLRYVYCNDMVTRLPYDDNTLLFKHFGVCFYYNSCYGGKKVWEEPNKNYFSLFWFIPKFLNAVWELIRGFIIPYRLGPEYKEGWFLTTLRLIGLVIPGLSAHSPQDYNNSTRLGSLTYSTMRKTVSLGVETTSRSICNTLGINS